MIPVPLRRVSLPTPKTRIGLRILEALFRALERSRQRRALSWLSDNQLRDIGLSRSEVEDECAKPGWRR